jgi:hypothetical protein
MQAAARDTRAPRPGQRAVTLFSLPSSAILSKWPPRAPLHLPLLLPFTANQESRVWAKRPQPVDRSRKIPAYQQQQQQAHPFDDMARLGAGAVLALLVAVAAVAAFLAVPASAKSGELSAMGLLAAKGGSGPGPQKCSGAVGECDVDEAEELGLSGGGLGSDDAVRRTLAQRKPTNRYISYAALRADQVPCNKRGRSYYSNCEAQKAANPYRRGCSAITRCARNMN